MMDLGAALDLTFKVAQEQDATITIADVRDLLSKFNAAKSGKLGLSNLTKTEAIVLLQESIRTESLILQIIQNKDDGDETFAEIKSLAGSIA